MSSASFYDWEKSLQSDSSSQLFISPPSVVNKKSADKSKGTIDYFIEKNTESTPQTVKENSTKDDLNDIGDLIFRKIVKLWKMKNLE
jgi:hypothetical protein